MKRIILFILMLMLITIACGSSNSSKDNKVNIIRDCTMFDKEALESDGWEGDFWPVKSGTVCTRLDNKTYKIDDGLVDPMYYYKLDCPGYGAGYINKIHIR